MGTSNAIGHPKNNKSAPLASEEVVRDDEGEDISSSTTTAKTKTTVNRTIASNDVEYLAKREADIAKYCEYVFYSARYSDDTHEYRHVVLPKELASYLPKGQTATEEEWRSLGIRQSPGWEHYAIHRPEPHIMLFRRPLEFAQKYPPQQ